MGWYKLKTAKNKKKEEFSCIEFWTIEGMISKISIARNVRDNDLIIYDNYNQQFILYDILPYPDNLNEFKDYTDDMFVVLTHITKYDIPKTVVNKFLNKVNGLRNG